MAECTQALGDDQAILAEPSPGLMGYGGARLDQILADPVHPLEVLLLRTFHGDTAHRWPAHGFADARGIVRIMLVALHLRCD
jgi:hypothetical protein